MLAARAVEGYGVMVVGMTAVVAVVVTGGTGLIGLCWKGVVVGA